VTYLEEHPPARRQFRSPRRARPSGVVVVHTAEATPDTIGTDGAAEAVARFIVRRSDPGSYHDLVDSDTIIQLVPYTAEAFHDGTGSNPHSYGVSAATQAAKWASLPEEWRDRCVQNMARAAARYARWLEAEHNITIPPRRISRAQSENRVPGFISHAERDPARRTDPGNAFPWRTFLRYYAAELAEDAPTPTTPTGEFDMNVYEFLNTELGTKKKDGRPVTIGDSLRAAYWLAEQSQEGGAIDEQFDRIEEQTR
jgi:N-acetyl-anhydromuramyl-L-alanine amidase AmpD